MIDLNNTWCEATEENYKALLPLVYTQNISLSHLGKGSFYIKSDNTAYFSFNTDTPNIKYKQIHLVNGEFKYVEEKPKNNFKDYGFEADFEGEILKEYENQFVGMVYQNEANFGCSWDKKGRCLQPNGFGYINMNLKPIKKEWHENPNNFPCLIRQINCAYDESIEDDFLILRNIEDYNKFGGDYRHATKEEVLSLLVKE